MSDTEMRRLFEAVLVTPSPDATDIDAAISAGRRRQRRRTTTMLLSAAAVVVVVGGVVVGAVMAKTPAPLPAVVASPAVTVPAADSGVLVTSAQQLSGVWATQTLDGKDVSTVRDRWGNPLVVTFHPSAGRVAWSTSDECNRVGGGLTVAKDGGLQWDEWGSTLALCLATSDPARQAAVERNAKVSLLEADHARVVPAGKGPAQLLLLKGDTVVASYEFRSVYGLGGIVSKSAAPTQAPSATP